VPWICCQCTGSPEKELRVEDIALYGRVRICDNNSSSRPDDGNVTSKEEEDKKWSSSSLVNASLEPARRSERKWQVISKPGKKNHWFWFCCQCSHAPVAADGYNDTCLDWDCRHTWCSGCRLEEHKVRDRA
jgi:hypothetical protein